MKVSGVGLTSYKPVESNARIRIRISGAEGQDRTVDTRFFRPVLYQLSYLGDPRRSVTADCGGASQRRISTSSTQASTTPSMMHIKSAPAST
jgi:hypothetical protein